MRVLNSAWFVLVAFVVGFAAEKAKLAECLWCSFPDCRHGETAHCGFAGLELWQFCQLYQLFAVSSLRFSGKNTGLRAEQALELCLSALSSLVASLFSPTHSLCSTASQRTVCESFGTGEIEQHTWKGQRQEPIVLCGSPESEGWSTGIRQLAWQLCF